MTIFVLRLTDVHSVSTEKITVVTDGMLIQHESDFVHYVCGCSRFGVRSVFKNVKMFL